MAKTPYVTTKHLQKTEYVLRGEIKETEKILRGEIKETEHVLRGEIQSTAGVLRTEMKSMEGSLSKEIGRVEKKGDVRHEKVMNLLDTIAKTTLETNKEIKALTGMYQNHEKRITKNERSIQKVTAN